MPIIRSSMKDLRRTARRSARNKASMGALRTAVKRVRLQIAHRDPAAARTELASAIRALDRAADRGFIHKNLAARTKSRLTRQISRLGAAPKS